jgi:hypothetical protein
MKNRAGQPLAPLSFHPEQRPMFEQAPMLSQAAAVQEPAVQTPTAQAPPGHWESKEQAWPALGPPLQAMPHCEA